MPETFLRCSHCRGFSESSRDACRYCRKAVPIKDAAGKAKLFPDRATCRAIQIAEFEQLPPEAHKDCMRPDPELLDKRCFCLHCGDEEAGPFFEAVEMRWMANEHMWACPCTTCGGRGFTFDVHLAERLWQCDDCRLWYKPADGNFKASNVKCPKCGSTSASGWFDDEELTPEQEAELQREYEEYEAKRKEEERLGLRPPLEEWKPEEWKPEEPIQDSELPDPADPLGSMMASHPEDGPMADDIDFPRDCRKPDPGKPLKDDDIPW